MAKDEDYRRLIHTSRWIRLRREVLRLQPLCERCKEEGIIRTAQEIHHIIPVESALTFREKESLMFDVHNLKALCHACHVQEHFNIGRSGKKCAKRKAEEQIKRFLNRFA